MVDGNGIETRIVRPPDGDDNSAVAFDAALRRHSGKADGILYRKHMDYGPRNIADAPGGPLMGLAVRIHDKVARLSNLLATGNDPEFESLYDTLLDIRNYGQIGMMVIEGDWDK